VTPSHTHNRVTLQRSILNTDHLFIDASDRKIKVRGNMKIILENKAVIFTNHVVQIVMARSGERIFAAVNGEGPFLVEKYHVSYNTYPLIRKALQ